MAQKVSRAWSKAAEAAGGLARVVWSEPLREKAELYPEEKTPTIEWPCPRCGQNQKSRAIQDAGSYCAACAEETGEKRPAEKFRESDSEKPHKSKDKH